MIRSAEAGNVVGGFTKKKKKKIRNKQRHFRTKKKF